MRDTFKPGVLTRPQAKLLNELLELSEQWRRFRVEPPLYLVRPAGIPNIRVGTLAGTVLAKITGHDGSNPPVHTASLQTASTGGAAADAAPAVTYSQVFFPLGSSALETGTLVCLVPIADSANRYWAFPLQVGFPARLTSAWDAVTGYSWSLLVRTGLTLAPASPAITGTGAITPDIDTELTTGTDGWMEPDPTGAGMIFLPAPVDTAKDCTGCEWLAGLVGDGTDCLAVSVDGTDTGVILSTLDEGATWTSDGQTITICGIQYSVRFTPGDPAQLSLFTVAGMGSGSGGTSHAGQSGCCGCNYKVWGFSKRTLCPETVRSTDGPCYDVVKVRIDWVKCATDVTIECCPDPVYLKLCVDSSSHTGSYASLPTEFIWGEVAFGVSGWRQTVPFDIVSGNPRYFAIVPCTGVCGGAASLDNTAFGYTQATIFGTYQFIPLLVASHANLPFCPTAPDFTATFDHVRDACSGAGVPDITVVPFTGSTCDCTPIAGWDGPGYYWATDATPGDCTNATVVFLSDANKCDASLKICCGPFTSAPEATANPCSRVNGCCPSDTIPNTLHGTCSDGRTVTLVWDGSNWNGGSVPDGNVIEMYCDMGTWRLLDGSTFVTVNGSAPVCNPFSVMFPFGGFTWTVTP